MTQLPTEILATRSYLPKVEIANEEIVLEVGASVELIEQPPRLMSAITRRQQNELEAKNAGCLDINTVRNGFVHGLVLAQAQLALKRNSYALVVAAELYSRFSNFKDRKTAALFRESAAVAGIAPPSMAYGTSDVHGAIRTR